MLEGLKTVEKDKKTPWLSEKVQRYSRAIAFSIAAILWSQTWIAVADNLLSDSTIKISKAVKNNTKSKENIANFTNTLADLMIKSKYKYIEQNSWTLSVIKEKLQDQCQIQRKECDNDEKIIDLKKAEIEIVSYFEENINSRENVLSLILNKENVSRMLTVLPHIESILNARHWENYTDILNKKTVASGKYSLVIVFDTEKEWWYRIRYMMLDENK